MISTSAKSGQSAKPSIRFAEVFPGVVISNRGDVYGRTPCVGNNGYAGIRVAYKLYAVHRLVAETFLRQPSAGEVVCHLNDDKTDNRVENLCWGTPRKNARQAVQNERYVSRLTLAQVKKARRLAHEGESPGAIADRWGLPRYLVYNAVRGVTWTSITEPPAIPNKRRKFGYTQAVRDWAVQQYRKGVSSTTVAGEVGCDPKTVRNWAAA